MAVIEARMKHYDLPKKFEHRGKVLNAVEVATLEYAGTVQGRLWLKRYISEEQREAADRALKWRQAAQQAAQVPDSLAVGTNGGSTGELVTDDYVTWATKAVTIWEVCVDWINQKRAWDVFEQLFINQNEPTELERAQAMVLLSYLAKRMGLDSEGAAG